MHKRKSVLIACCLSIVALLSAGCGGSDTVVDSGTATATSTDSSSDDTSDGATDGSVDDATDDSADDDESAAEPTAVPSPTSTSVPVADDDSSADQDPVDPPADADVAAPSSREEAMALLIGDGFAASDVECLVDGAYEVFGIWDFDEIDPDPAQAVELDILIDTCVKTIPGPAAGSPPPGTDAVLDALWVSCNGGDPEACNDLYFDSPLDSDYEMYGFTCGGRALATCSLVLGGDDGDGGGEIVGPAAGSPPPGDDAALDVLWVACDGGSAEACTDLFWQSPSDSDYEAFGISCGGRTVRALCEDILDN